MSDPIRLSLAGSTPPPDDDATSPPQVVQPPASTVQPPQPETPANEVAAADIAAADGTLAARLRAKAEQLKHRTLRLPVPPADVWGGELILVVKPVALREGMPVRKLVVDATDHLEILNPDTGTFDVVPDGWTGIGRLMGIAGEGVTVGEIVALVCGSQEVMAGLAEQVIAFIVGRQSQLEQALGE